MWECAREGECGNARGRGGGGGDDRCKKRWILSKFKPNVALHSIRSALQWIGRARSDANHASLI